MRNEKGQFIKGSNGWLGRHHSLETRNKLSEKAIGRIMPQEVREKIRLANKKPNAGQFQKGFIPKNKGKGEPIEGDKECPICHKTFHYKRTPYKKGKYITYGNKAPQTCSKECRYKLISQSEKGEMVKRKCIACGKDFEIYPAWFGKRSKGDGIYCSRECRWKDKIQPQFSKAHKNRARMLIHLLIVQGTLKRLPCEICGKLPTEAHHYKGYKPENWLDIKWLCDGCHHREHERMRQAGENKLL